MGLRGNDMGAWGNFLDNMRQTGFAHNQSVGCINLGGGGGTLKKGQVKIAETYMELVKQQTGQTRDCWLKNIWKEKVHIKIMILIWLVWKDKNLAWSNL